MVSTPLKNIKVSWDYHSQYMEKKHVPNHQAGIVILRVIHLHVFSKCFFQQTDFQPNWHCSTGATFCKAVILGIWNQPLILTWMGILAVFKDLHPELNLPKFLLAKHGKAPSKSVRYITFWWIFPCLLMNWWTPSFSCWKCCVWRWSRTPNSQFEHNKNASRHSKTIVKP